MNDRKGIGDILSTLTIAVLFLVILLLVVFSAASYQHAADVESNNNNDRALLAYVTSCVKANGLNRVEAREFEGATGLAVSAEGSRYERRIYMKDGSLMEEYAEKGQPAIPEDALVIGETKKFDVKDLGGGLFEIRTDEGVSYVREGIE